MQEKSAFSGCLHYMIDVSAWRGFANIISCQDCLFQMRFPSPSNYQLCKSVNMPIIQISFFYIKGIELFIAWYFVSVRCPHESTSFSYTWFMIEWKTSFTDFCSVIWEKTSRFLFFFFLHIGKLIPQIEN